jgi:predicted ester cyclase
MQTDTTHEPVGVALYRAFAQMLNARDFTALDRVLAQDFTDHHPGLVDVHSLTVYRRNLAAVTTALDMRAEPEAVVAAGDLVFTRVKLAGRHVGTFLGLEPTGAPLSWYTHELWRIREGCFAERWAVDDLLTLLRQAGAQLPVWTDPAT